MKSNLTTRTINGVEVEMGSGNVFADLGLPNADELKIKSGLAIEASAQRMQDVREVGRLNAVVAFAALSAHAAEAASPDTTQLTDDEINRMVHALR